MVEHLDHTPHRQVTPVGATEVAKMLGLSRQRVHDLRLRADWPASVGKVGQSLVWDAADIEAWLLAHPSRAGRGSRR